LLWRVTGGAYAAQRLVENYYTQFINAAQQGGMEAVCRTEHFAEVIAANPANRARLTALDPQRFIGIMEDWRRAFNDGAQHPVIGLSPDELRSLTMPACIIPGNDRVHPREPGQAAHRLMPNSEYREVLTEDRPDRCRARGVERQGGSLGGNLRRFPEAGRAPRLSSNGGADGTLGWRQSRGAHGHRTRADVRDAPRRSGRDGVAHRPAGAERPRADA
jgi:hypothetical protein